MYARRKGRSYAAEVAALLVSKLGLRTDDVRVPPTTVAGSDLWLSPRAHDLFPLDVECKRQERWDVGSWIRQCELRAGRAWVIFFRRNRGRSYVVLDAETFLDLLRHGRVQGP